MISLKNAVILAFFLSLSSLAQSVPALEMTSKILEMSETAADVSSKAYHTPEEQEQESYDEYESFEFHNDDENYPNQMVVAKKDGRCYLGFRGTTESWVDWLQNLIVMDEPIHKDNDPSEPSCTARYGFSTFLADNSVGRDALQDVEQCAQEYCSVSTDDCIVIAGHSKGGAQATVASIVLQRYNPTVITFGGLPSVDKGCPYVPSDRTYRFVNSISEKPYGGSRVIFDMIPFLNIENIPWYLGGSCITVNGEAMDGEFNEIDNSTLAEISAIQHSSREEVQVLETRLAEIGHLGDHYGYGIILGDDPENSRYYAWNTENLLKNEICLISSTGLTGETILDAHGMTLHLERVRNFLQVDVATIGVAGFRDGTVGCDMFFHDLCQSGTCDEDYLACAASSQ